MKAALHWMCSLGRGSLPLAPALCILLIPKCPVCYAAWGGIFSAIGLSFAPQRLWLELGMLGLALGLLFFVCRRSRPSLARGPFLIGIAGLALLFAGRWWLHAVLLPLGGLLLFSIGAALAAFGAMAKQDGDCCHH